MVVSVPRPCVAPAMMAGKTQVHFGATFAPLASQKFLGSVGMTSSDGDGSVRVTDTIPGTRIAFKPI